MKVPLDSLMIANEKASKINKQISHSGFARRSNSKIEYDCRGMRLDEFQNLIETITSDLLMGDSPFINIIHGHGTGVLKNWLRTYVKNHKDLKIDKSETGNDGETKITLI